MAIKTPKAGDIGLTRIGGVLGFFVMIGQALAQDASRYTHAFIVIDENTVIAAQPGGARRDALAPLKNKAIYMPLELTDDQRQTIVREAIALEGTPYSYLDYLAIALLRFGFKPKWLRKYIKDKGHLICSQMADLVLQKAAVHLFNDGRESMDVTPGDLSNWIIEHDWIDGSQEEIA